MRTTKHPSFKLEPKYIIWQEYGPFAQSRIAYEKDGKIVAERCYCNSRYYFTFKNKQELEAWKNDLK